MHLTCKTLILGLLVLVPLLAVVPTASQSFTTITTLTTITTETTGYETTRSIVGTTDLTSTQLQTGSNTILVPPGIPVVNVFTATSRVTSASPVYGTQTRTIIANSTQTFTATRTEEVTQGFGLGQSGLVLGVILGVLIVGFGLFAARRKHGKALHEAVEKNVQTNPASPEIGMRGSRSVSTLRKLEKTEPESQPIAQTTPGQQTISTGYAELDQMLAGGLPEGYVIGIVSASYDERDLIVRRIIDSTISSRRAVFYVTGESGRAENLAHTYSENFYVFYPQAGQAKMVLGRPNVTVIPRIENLSDLNITLNQAIADKASETKSKLLVLDILSDMLLVHKSVTTRRWLSDFVGKRKAQGFTVLATLNPLIAPKEEIQTIVDSFDGVIEIYEKEIREKSRRFLVIKKMYARRYSENELMLDKDKLF